MIRAIKKIHYLLRSIIKSRRMLLSLSMQDFKRRFAGSYFGTVWGFIQPLLTILTYWVVFQFGFRSGDVGQVPFVLWFMCGIIPWLYISEAFSTGSNALLEYSYLVKKVVFDIEILPLVKVLSAGIIHLCFVGLLVVIACLVGYWPTFYTLQIIYYMVCAVALVFGLTLFTSAIMVFFRDLGQIIGIILLMGMWSTPIAWNLETVVPAQYHFFFKLNPIFYIVEGYRDSFIGGVWFWQKYNQTLYFWVAVLFIALVGAVVFNRLRPHFADVL